MRVCNKCNTERELNCFYKTKYGHRKECKFCISERQKAYRAANPEAIREKWRRASKKYMTSDRRWNKTLRKYGLTEETYNIMFDQQSGQCKICKSDRFLVVDHCHDTGSIRGLLCHHCNSGLGQFRDSEDFLLAAIEYLQQDRSKADQQAHNLKVLGSSPSPATNIGL